MSENKEIRKVIKKTIEKPVFINPIIEELYHHDLRIDHEIIRQILALPRESLLTDLSRVLYDSIERFDWFSNKTEWEEATHNFILHAIFLLNELKAEELLGVLLDVLRQDEEYQSYWFNDFLTEDMWESIYTLGFHKLDELSAFIKEPDRYCFCRTEVAVAVSQIAIHHPERRDEVVSWFRDIINFFIEHEEDDRIIDYDLTGLFIGSITDMSGVELIPEITEMYKQGMIIPGFHNTLDVAIKRCQNKRNEEYYKRNLHDIFSKYDEIVSTWIPYRNGGNQAEGHIRPDDSGMFTPYIAEKEPGRNDPCPCGSGKKYKKCCMGKS